MTGGFSVTPIVRTDAQGRVKGVFLINVAPGETPHLKLAVRRPAGTRIRIRTVEGVGAPLESLSSDGGVEVGLPSLGGWRPLWVEFGE